MFAKFLKPPPQLSEKAVVSFRNNAFGLPSLLVRSDKDLGGYSSVNLSVIGTPRDQDPSAPAPKLVSHGEPEAFGRFEGNLSLDLPEGRSDLVRLGYAMFRTKDPEPGFLGLAGPEFHDWSMFNQLALRVRGDLRRYFINIQAETPYPTDLYQHRLFLKTPGEWETVTVPFSSFILTNGGVIQEQQQLDTEHIRSVGIGLIDGQYGPYRLDVDWIKVISGDVSVLSSPPARITSPKAGAHITLDH